jgi:hypothetical protein
VQRLPGETGAAEDEVRRHPERDEQREIVKLLRTIGAAVYVLGTTRRKGDHPGTMQTPGIPDIYAILPAPAYRPLRRGMGVWIEVKAKGGRLRPEQAGFAAHCCAWDIPHVVGGLDAVIDFLVSGGWVKR